MSDAVRAPGQSVPASSRDTAAQAAGGLPLIPQAGYGVGQIAGQIFRDVPSLLLLFFMTNSLGIAPALAGTAIFVPKLLVGLLSDLGVGILSDRLQSRFPRRWWLLVGALASPAVLILLFHVPALSQGGKALYIAAIFSLYMLAFATFSVPYLAVAGELSDDPGQRTVIMAWRLIFTAIGVLIADSLAPIFIQMHGANARAYQSMALILAVICSTCLVVAFFGTAALARHSTRQLAPSLWVKLTLGDALAALAERRFSVLLFANLMQLAGGGMGYASMLYFFAYNLARPDAFKQIGIVTLIASATMIAAQPFWVAVARRAGKKRTYVAASIFYGLVMGGWGLLGPYGIEISYGFAALLGISNSGWTLLSYSMVADIAGEKRAGLYSAVWIAADKIGFALGGTLLIGLVLSAFTFDSTRAAAGLSQSQMALHGVKLAFSACPCILSMIAAAIFASFGSMAEARPQP
jgi:GPH family glycoside/pentoside/hexuronide:cation symporter